MTVHLVTFSDYRMSRAAELCIESAKRHGVDGRAVIESPDILAPEEWPFDFTARGCGYWAWKPHIVGHALEQLTDGDILIYADAGVEFINNVNYIIDRMDQDIFLFGNNYEHAHWCKRDVIDEVWPYSITSPPEPVSDNPSPWGPEYRRTQWADFGKQVQASVIFFRVSNYTRKFVKEWLDWCLFEGGRLIDDSPSRTPNHPEFREHRHDQAILTTLAYREGLKLHYWPAQYNDGAFTYEKLPEYAGDDYPILFHHHRRRNADWEQAA